MLIASDTVIPVLMFCLAMHVFFQQVSEEQSYCKSVVKKQQQQAQLQNLPRHHPLIREVHSDDGTQLSISSAYCKSALCCASLPRTELINILLPSPCL